jgi:hypothetical protein
MVNLGSFADRLKNNSGVDESGYETADKKHKQEVPKGPR